MINEDDDDDDKHDDDEDDEVTSDTRKLVQPYNHTRKELIFSHITTHTSK